VTSADTLRGCEVAEATPTGAADSPSPGHGPGTPAAPRRGRAARVVAVALAAAAALAFIGLITFGVLAQAPNSTIDDSLAAGRAAPAPQFVLAVLQRGELGAALDRRLAFAVADGRLGLRQLRGTPVVLNIWASWCDPCRQEAPLLERAWRTDGRPHGTLFLGLDQQDLTGDAHAFMRSYGVDYPNVRDPGNDVPLSYGATGLPETYFISARGDVVDHVIGVISPGDLRAGLAALGSGRPLGVRSGGARRLSR
jgi:cytochrome c biogenesis protein CcmG/thiol:disulfide interchange protein DsbE